MSELDIILLPEVMRQTHLGRRTLYDGIKAGTFPAPFKLGGKNAWFQTTIATWIFEQSEKGRGAENE